MKKIVLVNNGILPLPSVKGGAVEGLMNLLIELNEKYKLFEFVVYSIYNDNAKVKSKEYQYTEFRYVKNNLIYKIYNTFCRIINFITLRTGGYYKGGRLYQRIITDIQKEGTEKFAAIILEGCPINSDYLKRKSKLPIIQRIHNTPTHFLKHYDIRNAQATDLYLGISNYICNCLKDYEGKFCSNIELLYNSVDFSMFEKPFNLEEISVLKKELGINKEDRVIMFSGRLREFKGVKQLLEAMLLCKDIKNLKLLIVGSFFFSSNKKDHFGLSLNSLIKELGHKVIFTGYVPYHNIYKYYKLADICAFPSTWEEPFALTCLEALVCGKPVIITNSGGMSEVVNNECAIVVPNDINLSSNLSNAIHSLINDPTKCTEMGEAAVKRAQFFHPDIHYQNFATIIEKYISL